MNLAIHDISIFRSLNFQGATVSFAERGIIPWITPEVLRNWSGLETYLESGVLRLYDIGAGHGAFFATFKQRYKQPLAAREAKMLYLAEHSGSVLLAAEPVVTQGAKLHNLRVWSGEMRDLDQYFPCPGAVPTPAAAHPSAAPVVPPSGHTVILSTEFPTDRQVPDRKESLCVPRDKSRAGRRGSLSAMTVHAA